MKIVKNTPERLILEDRPVLVAAVTWLVGLAMLLATVSGEPKGIGTLGFLGALGIGTLVLAWFYFPFQRISFDRDSGKMCRRVARITGATTSTIPLEMIKSAAGQGNWSDGMRMERLVLLTNQRPYPLEFGYFGTSRKELIDAINTWLTSTRSS